jgi:hypothetical protein
VPGDEWLAVLRDELPQRIAESAPLITATGSSDSDNGHPAPQPTDMPTPEEMAAAPFGIVKKKKPVEAEPPTPPAAPDNGGSDTDVADDLGAFSVT